MTGEHATKDRHSTLFGCACAQPRQTSPLEQSLRPRGPHLMTVGLPDTAVRRAVKVKAALRNCLHLSFAKTCNAREEIDFR